MKSEFFMITLNIENHGLTRVFDIDAKAQYSRQESFAVYLVELEKCVVYIRVVTTR